MRITWLEALCVAAIALAALQARPDAPAMRLYTPPTVEIHALKDRIVAVGKDLLRDAPPRHVADARVASR